MKIAQISQHYLPIVGGQEVYIEQLNRVLRDAGWSPLVYQFNRGVQRADIVTVQRIPGLGRLIPDSEPFQLNVMLAPLRRRIARADVIIAHYAVHAWPLRAHARKTIVLSHGIEWHLENQTWADRARERAARACLADFPHVVNDTHYLRHFGIEAPPGERFFSEVAPGKWFIPNCVDTARFTRTAGIPEWREKNILLVPRQVVRDRGIDLAIRAFKLVSEQRPELRLHILGKIRSGAYIDLCRALVRQLGLESRVTFQDHIENAEMADAYSSALLTLIPTLRREGTSLSALESMACGTATVSTDVAGLRDLPTVQAPPEDIAFAEAISRTLADRERIGAEQQTAVRRTFNLEKWAEAWRRVVEKVAAGG